jgi:hypothetical protein
VPRPAEGIRAAIVRGGAVSAPAVTVGEAWVHTCALLTDLRFLRRTTCEVGWRAAARARSSRWCIDEGQVPSQGLMPL